MLEANRFVPLSTIGIETKELFRKVDSILDEDPEQEGKPKAQFAAEADRFGLWAVNMGLFVSVLEYYESDGVSSSDETEWFKGDDAGSEPSDDGWKDDSDGEIESDMELLLESVRDPIDRLYKLSTLIRNPSSRFASSKAHSHKQIDAETGVDLLEVIEAYEVDFVRSVFLQYRTSKTQEEEPEQTQDGEVREVDAEELDSPGGKRVTLAASETFLIHRLARANVHRRQPISFTISAPIYVHTRIAKIPTNSTTPVKIGYNTRTPFIAGFFIAQNIQLKLIIAPKTFKTILKTDIWVPAPKYLRL
ncbi:hypothetical protein ABW20_dc0108486 [Dactylellina cionopaga]|nr:hypothetical protein ABW20_dc0108486 [Dactylellina cionopaga]